MRHNKPFTIISYKKEEPEIHFHCRIPGHESVRLKEIPDKGWWCPLGCGPSIELRRIVETYEQKET